MIFEKTPENVVIQRFPHLILRDNAGRLRAYVEDLP